MTETILELKGVKKSFQKEAGQDVLVLDDVHLCLKKNEIVALLGKSGCGKSTTGFSLMRLLPNNGRIESGSVEFEGRPDYVPR